MFTSHLSTGNHLPTRSNTTSLFGRLLNRRKFSFRSKNRSTCTGNIELTPETKYEKSEIRRPVSSSVTNLITVNGPISFYHSLLSMYSTRGIRTILCIIKVCKKTKQNKIKPKGSTVKYTFTIVIIHNTSILYML